MANKNNSDLDSIGFGLRFEIDCSDLFDQRFVLETIVISLVIKDVLY